MFRVAVTSADGHAYAVTIQVDTHRKTPSKAVFNDLADRLRVPRGQVDEILDTWGPDQLRKHLSALTHEQLRARTPINDQLA
jgi:hypothetical protein